MHLILELKDIHKSYSHHKAVDGVSFSVPKQSIFGMLGPNGSGKTTTIRMITNIIAPDGGEIIFNGEKLSRELVSQMGYMPEERGLYKRMKIWEQLVYLAQLKGLSSKEAKDKVYKWMDRLNIKDWWGKKIDELSKGMSQKIQFISTVVHEPKLIILDEPFSGLDPVNSETIKNEITRLRDEGATIIFSTHRMEQVEEICEEIVLYNSGKVILNGKVKDIKQQFKQNRFLIKYDGTEPVLNENFPVVSRHDHELEVSISNGTPNDLLRSLVNQNTNLTAYSEILPSLNEIFISQVTQS